MQSSSGGHPRRIIKSFEAKELKKRSFAIKAADIITSFAGSVPFFLANVIFFAVWIIINVGAVPSIAPFDPFPFVMLTTVVSLEAIMLAIFVLMSQNRSSIISSLRDEIQLQMNLVSEQEITKILEILRIIMEKQKIKIDDPEFTEMVKKTDLSYIERQLEKQLNPNAPLFTPEEIAEAVTKPFKQTSHLLRGRDSQKS